MNRISFLKNLLFGGTTIAIPQLSTNSSKEADIEFSFDELFITHDGNNILIYPKKESIFYKRIQSSFADRMDLKKSPTNLPVHSLSIPIKNKYKWEDFLSIKYYFECVYGRNHKYTTEGYGVSYRFVKDGLDRMHLQVFIA